MPFGTTVIATALNALAGLSCAFLGRPLSARELEALLDHAGPTPSTASLSKAFFASDAVKGSLGSVPLTADEITRRFARNVLGFEATEAQVALVRANGPKDFGELTQALVSLVDGYVGNDGFVNQLKAKWRDSSKATETLYQRHEAAALVTSLSVGILGWAPDSKTLTDSVNARLAGASEADLATRLLNTTAAKEHFGSEPGPVFEVFLLTSVLGRSPTTFEIEVVRAVNIADRGLLAAALVRVVDQYAGTDPALLESSARLQNRTEFGLAIQEVLGSKLAPTSLSRADAAFAASRNLVRLVDQNEITKDAAIAYLSRLATAS
ncbi:MAG: hypothetical protein EBV34_11495, partial [Betaproteobacteria bacterium]|nr:hypothetical protein [Betaproteobacteria bacterium]